MQYAHFFVDLVFNLRLERVTAAVRGFEVSFEGSASHEVPKLRQVMPLNDTDSELEVGALNRRAHKHLHRLWLGAHMRLKLLRVVVRTRHVRANLHQTLHVLEVLGVGVVQRHPLVLDFVVLAEID